MSKRGSQPSAPLFEELDRIQQLAHSARLHLAALPETGSELRDEAMESVLKAKAARDYRDLLIETLKLFPVRSLITIEQLTGEAGRPPANVHYNAVGAIVAGMAKRGLIEKTGRMIQAQRPKMHATELAEWRVLKYK